MKAIVPIILAILIIGGIVYFNSKKTEPMPEETVPAVAGDEISENTDGTYVFDPSASQAKWTGSKKVIKDYYDNGTVDIKSGHVVFADGAITGGEVVFDMTTITAVSTGKGDGQDMLSTHLKSEDFFEVQTYPEATFSVNGSQKTSAGYDLSGSLTIKQTTKEITVPVTAAMDNGNVILQGRTTVNRADYDVRFGSESFFDNLGDNVINDDFVFEFYVVARP